MAFSPKIMEYVGRIAPKEKAALYMGSLYLPMAFGNFFGGFIAGGVYNNLADKYRIIRNILPEMPDSQSISNARLFDSACRFLNTDTEGLNKILWESGYPGSFGALLFGIGTLTVVMLYLYDRYVTQKKVQ